MDKIVDSDEYLIQFEPLANFLKIANLKITRCEKSNDNVLDFIVLFCKMENLTKVFWRLKNHKHTLLILPTLATEKFTSFLKQQL